MGIKNDKIILGIDPGTNIMGYGAIHIVGREIRLLGAGVISLQKTEDHPLKLKKIFEGTIELLKQYKPDELAIESPFFGKNVQSMLKLGRAQGIAIAAALTRSIPVFEYSPKKIKQSITGNGNASKEQVAAMLQKILAPILKGENTKSPFRDLGLDATDALGAAVCHYFQQNSTALKNGNDVKKFSGWKAFLSSNPERKIGKQ